MIRRTGRPSTPTGSASQVADYPHRGDVWLARLDKVRPVVILSRDPMGRELNALISVYGTHTVYGVNGEVPVGAEDDFDEGTVLNADNLQLVYQDELLEHVGHVRVETLAAICRAVAFAIACTGGSVP
jgi:mRNA interferase MazF